MNILLNNAIPALSSLLLLIAIGLSIYFIYKILSNNSKTKKLYKVELMKKASATKNKIEFQYIKSLKKRINLYFLFKSKKQLAPIYIYSIIGIEVVVLVGFAVANKIILAIALPLIFHYFVLRAFDFLTIDIHSFIQEELPITIKHMIKIFSKTSDLKTVIYETSKNLKDPLRGVFFDLSRRMLSENYEKCLMEFAEDLDDIWMHSLIFLLMSYKEQSKKEDIIKNLTTLADILDKENYIKVKALTDKKAVTIMNYALLVIAIAGFIGNLIFNESSLTFFFDSIGGMIALIVGISAIFGTILINLMLSRKNEGGK